MTARSRAGADVGHVARALVARWPELEPVEPLRVVGSGFRSTAYLTASGNVVRVGRSADAAGDYAREWRTLPVLREQLDPSLLPKPDWYAEPCGAFPHGALGYPLLAGRHPAWGEPPPPALAPSLGRFLAALHALPPPAGERAGLPVVDARARLLGGRKVVRPALQAALARDELARVEAWWERLAADQAFDPSPRALCHHDLWHDNLLVDEAGALTGVLDWAHAELGDPAHDFAPLWYFGGAFVDEVVQAYRTAGGTFGAAERDRAERYREGRELGGLAWAVEHDDRNEIADSIAKVRRSPLLAR